MLKIKDTSTGPPDGWDYQQPDGPMLRGNTLGLLVSAVFDYRIAHGLPTANVQEEVEDEICRRKPIRCKVPVVLAPGERKVSAQDALRFLITMKEWVKDGTLVDQAEADRRAEICAGCRFNDRVEMSCFGCAGIYGIFEQIIGQRKTRMDHELKNCKICSCFNAIQAWVPLGVLQRASGGLEMPDDTGQKDADGAPIPCWKRTIE